HTVELIDEVHVPRRTPELTVRRRPQPHPALHVHHRTDRLVLHGLQLVRGDRTLRGLFARFVQFRRPQKAADVVCAERRCLTLTHTRIVTYAYPVINASAVWFFRVRGGGAGPVVGLVVSGGGWRSFRLVLIWWGIRWAYRFGC